VDLPLPPGAEDIDPRRCGERKDPKFPKRQKAGVERGGSLNRRRIWDSLLQDKRNIIFSFDQFKKIKYFSFKKTVSKK